MTPLPDRRLRVLVVDDSALVRKAITDALAADPARRSPRSIPTC
jgi:chemotaxis response regulator CheB